MNILWVKTELLHPLDAGGRIRTFNIVKKLAHLHRVTYLCYADSGNEKEAITELSKYVDKIVVVERKNTPRFSFSFYLEVAKSLATPFPYTIKKYYTREMADKITELVGRDDFDSIICDFLAPSMNFGMDIKKRSVLFQHNVESQIWKRHVRYQRNPVKRFLFQQECRKLLRYEENACREFEKVLAVSKEDRDWFSSHFNITHVLDIPTGVDTDFFQPAAKEAEPGNIVFTGSMDWLPNEDAVVWFVEEIMPVVRAAAHPIRFVIVGRRPTAVVRKLGEDYPDVIVTGDVDDIRPYMANAAVFVVPIRIGGGTRMKIYEAMAMGKAVVSTSVGAEGLPLVNGKHLLIADSRDDFAGEVIRVLRDKGLATNLGSAGNIFVNENCGWDHVAEIFLCAVGGKISS